MSFHTSGGGGSIELSLQRTSALCCLYNRRQALAHSVHYTLSNLVNYYTTFNHPPSTLQLRRIGNANQHE